ncbi:MAG: ferrochelatase [Alphaproteobacteria bacterium]
MSQKIAVVLFNLGGPDGKESIEPFLMNFFMDKNIIAAPKPVRYLLAKYISYKRSRREAGDSYAIIGDRSPLLKNTNAQRDALEKVLNDGENENTYKVFTCMRYWNPMAEEVVKDVKDWGAEKILLLPMYPQFSTTTTWSSLGVWNDACAAEGVKTETSMVCCYPENDGFIEASAQNILIEWQKAKKHDKVRILFSAHGLPEKIVEGGDPYQWQCEQTAAKIAARVQEELGDEMPEWKICYQSRVGRLKWITPSTEDMIEQSVDDGYALIIYPHAFTQEHVETLVELDVEYRELAEKHIKRGYYRAQTVGTHPVFIDGLAKLVQAHEERSDVTAEGFECICPEEFGRCCMRSGNA